VLSGLENCESTTFFSAIQDDRKFSSDDRRVPTSRSTSFRWRGTSLDRDVKGCSVSDAEAGKDDSREPSIECRDDSTERDEDSVWPFILTSGGSMLLICAEKRNSYHQPHSPESITQFHRSSLALLCPPSLHTPPSDSPSNSSSGLSPSSFPRRFTPTRRR
jgi:hypothetical protein